MRAQRGWFTMFGNSRKPLEVQCPRSVVRIDLTPASHQGGLEFLRMGGFKPYSIYPDLDHLAEELIQDNAYRFARFQLASSRSKASGRRKAAVPVR